MLYHNWGVEPEWAAFYRPDFPANWAEPTTQAEPTIQAEYHQMLLLLLLFETFEKSLGVVTMWQDNKLKIVKWSHLISAHIKNEDMELVISTSSMLEKFKPITVLVFFKNH